MDESRISGGDARSQRRNFLSLAVAATAGAIASVFAKSNEALAGHDGTNVFHLGVLNDGPAVADPTQLVANIEREALGPEGPFPPSAALMIFNGDGITPNRGWALFANGNPGAVGGVFGFSDSGDGIRGGSNTGTAVRAESRSPSQPALVANWTGPAGSGNAGVAGSSTGGPGVHGLSPTMGVLGHASQLIPGGISLTDGTGVRGESGSGPGVLGASVSGPGIRGQSQSGPGVQGFANPTNVGIHGVSSQGQHAGVAGQSNGTAPAVLGVHHGSSPLQSGSGVEGRSLFGLGVWGESENKSGVAGQSFSPGSAGVQGANLAGGPGVRGVGGAGPGVHGSSQSGAGVQGFANETGPGVEGFASTGTQPGVTGRPGVVGHASSTNSGVRGDSDGLGPGIVGFQAGPSGVAILAQGSQVGAIGLRTVNLEGGIALDVSGRARFTTAGNGTVPAKADSQGVSNAAVQANSNVIATLTSDPGDAQIAWVERNPGSGFVLHMTKKVGADTSFAYLITESA